jgi:hypothetical protein
MSFEVAYVLEDDVRWSMPIEDRDDVVKERSSCLVQYSPLRSRLGERLAGKPRAEDVVWWDTGERLRVANIAEGEAECVRKIRNVQVAELGIDFRGKHALVAEFLEGQMKAP